MEKIQMVDLYNQYLKIKEEVDAGIEEVIKDTAFINGQPVKKFASELSDYLNAGHAIPCGNGTDALQIALMALDLKPGDEVITSPFTFIATVEVIAMLKLKPVFVDVDERTFNIDPEKIEEKITDKTKCIIPVHLFGQSADMEPIMKIAQKNDIYVVEDNAQALGGSYTFSDGEAMKTGAIGHIGCTSFFPSKNLGAFGDGGALSISDDELGEKVRMIVNHGSRKKYHHEVVGVNSRLDTLQAVILREKLRHLDEYIEARRSAADFYDSEFNKEEVLETPYRMNNAYHVFHQYTLKVKEGRDDLKKWLGEKGIPSMVYYPIPLHLQKPYANFGYQEGDFPISEKLSKEVLSLPMHTELKNEQLKYITSSIKNFYITK